MKIDWVKKVEVKDKKRRLKDAKKIIEDWGLKMPENKDQFAIDFGLDDYENIGDVEFMVANELKEGYCGKFLFLFKNQTCPLHHHDKKHETFFIVKGKVLMHADKRKFTMKQGDCFVVKQGVEHKFSSVDGTALILEVSKPCEPGDSIFADEKIGKI
ncbi:MAG: cupin domain-containing protein [Candidatus Omnitrophica bacterium]|jgi:mannose-6-phosphate isomerase-like protein (cupin superfamily)|nr:cupin domain-containing protein [Candidatus Omnitrophota bacterium]